MLTFILILVQNGGLLQKSMSGLAAEVFAGVLSGLSGVEVMDSGDFQSADGLAAVQCSLEVRLSSRTSTMSILKQ